MKIKLNGSELLYLLTGEGVLQPETMAVLDRLRDDEDPKPAEHDWSEKSTNPIEDMKANLPKMIVSPPHGTPKEPELDTDCVPWDKRIHAASKAKLKNGRWRRRRNLDDETFERIKRELLSIDTERSEPQAPPPPPPPATDPPMDFGELMSLATEKGWDYPKLNEWATDRGLDGILLIMQDRKLFDEIYNELLAIKTE